MELKDFIKQFSHNNALWIENNKRRVMVSRYNNDEEWVRRTLMDWELTHTDIAEAEVISISNVMRNSEPWAVTIVINSDSDLISFVPELVTMGNSPLWLYERVHQVTLEGNCCGEQNNAHFADILLQH